MNDQQAQDPAIQDDNDALLDGIINDLGNEDDAPADVAEPTGSDEIEDAQAPDTGAAEDVQTPEEEEAPELTTADHALAFKINGESLTLGDLVQVYNNRSELQSLPAERAKIEHERKELEALRTEHERFKAADVPHQLLTDYLVPLVQSGAFPRQLYEYIANGFQEAIESGLYDPKAIEAQAAAAAREREFTTKEAELAKQAEQAQFMVSVANIERSLGRALVDADYSAIGDEMERIANQTGQVPTIAQAYESLKASNKIASAPKSKIKLAEQGRQTTTAPRPKASGKDAIEAALEAMMG